MVRQMHHTRSIRASMLLVVVTAMLGLCLPSASSEPAPQVIRLVWVQTSNHPDGKRVSWTSQLFNETRQFGRPAGTKVGAEVGVSHGAQYLGGIKLPGGVLEYSGKVKHLPHHGGIVVPVVDGSGAFAGVTGTYTRSDGDSTHPNSTIVVLRLAAR
jgi:hypothetical protein